MDATVVVATFGEQRWQDLANERAIPSVQRQTMAPKRCIQAHQDTLANARNMAAANADTEWLIFLDADDELAPDYIEQIDRKTKMSPGADLFVPAVQYVHPEHTNEPKMLGPFDLRIMNYIVIGAPVRRSIFEAAGGFWGERAWEDWSLWLRCVHLGAELVSAPRAVYRAHVNLVGRNRVPHPQQLHRDILRSFDDWCTRR